jgi:hypothetical protein
MNPERLAFAFCGGRHPFVKAIAWNDATPLLEGFAEGWPLFECLGLGVDALARTAAVPCPPIDQAPAGALRPSALEFRSDDEVLIGRRDIEARPIASSNGVLTFDAKCVGDLPPLLPRQGESSTQSIKPLQLAFHAQCNSALYRRCLTRTTTSIP